MNTNTLQKPAGKTGEQMLLDASDALTRHGEVVHVLDADDRKAMAASLLEQLEAHIDGRPSRHPETFQQQLKIIEGGTRRASIAPLLEQLEDGIAGGFGGGGGGKAGGSQTPLHVPALDLVNEIRKVADAEVSRIKDAHIVRRPGTVQPLDEAVKSWTAAALGAGDLEIARAVKTLRSWAMSIRTMLNPPIFQEVLAPCPECGERTVQVPRNGELRRTSALALQVIQGGRSFIQCRACESVWNNLQLPEMAAWLNATGEDVAA